MPAWAKLAWTNRARILDTARKLRWAPRSWMRLLGLAAVFVGICLAAAYGYLGRLNPTSWSDGQWAQMLVNITGFAILYGVMRSWWGRQDEVWDEVDKLRAEVEGLREDVYLHEHDIIEAEEDTAEIPVARTDTAEREVPTVERELGGRTFSFRAEETSALG